MELINKMSFILVATICLIVSFIVLLSNRKSRSNVAFFASGILVLLWIGFGYVGLNITKPVLFLRLNFAAVSAFFIAFYYFIQSFPTEAKRKNYVINRLFTTIGIIFVLLSSLTDLIIQNVTFGANGQPIYQIGKAGNFFYAYVLLITGFILYELIKKYFSLDKENKLKVIFFIFGAMIWTIFNVVFNIILPLVSENGGRYYMFGDYSVIFFLGFVAYAILKHQLFNIKVIATQSIVIILSIALFIQIFVTDNLTQSIITSIIWILATYGGWQLIKSVKAEIKQKEDLAKLAKELEKANAHLEEVDKLKDDFLSMASHELNTPIAAIEGYLSMILDEGMGGAIPAKARGYLESVFQSSKRLANLVKELLNVSRIESNRIHLIYEEKQIESLIDQCIMEVMSKAREAHHTLTFEKPKKPMPKTWLDTTRITEILINTIGNSIKYTPDGGKITVRVANDDKKIIVSIEDNGKGIPKDKAHCVFEKFTQVDVLKDEVKGTGLGMYIAKRFIELHKGKIWFRSEGADKGTTFYFSLPVLAKKPFDAHEGEGDVLH